MKLLQAFHLSLDVTSLVLTEKNGSRVFRIKDWKDQLKVEKKVGEYFVSHDTWEPVLEVLSQASTEESLTPELAQWQKTIPIWVSQVQVNFSSWNSLKVLATLPEARELLESNPALYVLWLYHTKSSHQNLSKIKLTLRKKRRALLGLFGLQEEEWLVKQLARITCTKVDLSDVKYLKLVCAHPTLFKELKSLPSFPIEWSEFFYKQPRFFLAKFIFSEIKKRVKTLESPQTILTDLQRDLFIYRDWIKLGKKRGVVDPEAELESCTDRQKIEYKLAEWKHLELLAKPWLMTVAKPPMDIVLFPEVRLPGSARIKALGSNHELWDEGQEMRHCVASYTAQVIRRECDIYHVEVDEESATLEVKWSKGLPHLGQLLSISNREPSLNLKKEVEYWFDEEKYQFLRNKKTR